MSSLDRPRVLLLSHRNVFKQEAWRCSFFEFESILQEIDGVQVVAPRATRWYPLRKRVALRMGEQFRTPLNPGIVPVRLRQEYDVFVTICEKPSELLNVQAVQGWRDCCGVSVCWLPEFYVRDMPLLKSCLHVLSQFDHVIFMSAAFEPFKKVLRGHTSYLPAGIDALRFCPEANPPPRSIDVLSIGRRSTETHHALLSLAKDEGLFYVYDTFADLLTHDLAEHRSLVANLSRRSRYFIVNPSKINVPEETGGQSEFGYRYFEGAAAGTIMVGERPRNAEFAKVFHWDDAVVDLPFGSTDIGALLREVDSDITRQRRIRTTNVVQCLRHHDWAHRWETILGMAGLPPLSQLLTRKTRLAQAADLVEENGIV